MYVFTTRSTIISVMKKKKFHYLNDQWRGKKYILKPVKINFHSLYNVYEYRVIIILYSAFASRKRKQEKHEEKKEDI